MRLNQQLGFAHVGIGIAEMRHGVQGDQAAHTVTALYHADGAVAHVEAGKMLKRNAGDGGEQCLEQRAVRNDGNAPAITCAVCAARRSVL